MGKQIYPDDHPKVNGQKKGKSRKRKKNMDDLKKELDMDDHIIPLNELATRLQTDLEQGLDENFAVERLHEYGPNTLTPPKQTPEIVKLLITFSGGFSLLLWFGAIMCIIAFVIQMIEAQAASLPVPKDNLWLAIVLAVVVILSGLFQYYQESKSSKIMNAFKKLIPYEAIVIRNGHQQSINAVKLVVGDLVLVKAGDRVPADIRVLSANDMKVDNSSLTGESEPQPRSGDCTNENPLETQNIAFFSTNVVEGTGKGVVIQTGDDTLMGRIAYLAAGMKVEKTTLAREIKRLVSVLSIFAFSVGVLFCVISFILGYKWIDAIVLFIGVVVANVPEGLLATVTVSLATAAKRMAGKNCLVKNLEAVETLGSTSTICSDKTGTLTQNRMTVSHLWYNDSIFEADLSVDQSMKTYDRSDAGWQTLLQCSMLCSRTEFKQGQEKITVLRRECLGDATESGLLRFGELAYGKVDQFRMKNKKVFEIPFNSTDKYQVSIHLLEKRAGGRQHLLVMKGAPERVIECCATILVNGSDVKLTDSWKKKLNDAYEILGGLGERVIGFCDIVLPNPEGTVFDAKANNVPRKGLRFVGLISLIDPPRPNVPSAVRLCRTAGIRVVMVTGDHPFTARAIARTIGLISETSETPREMAARLRIPEDRVDVRQCKARVVTGSELKLMSSSDLDEVIEWHDELVFARTSPQQKLIIVEAFQRSGAVVAVTGDGVNDSPALKKADIGVAMGIAGTDVTKQAAAMILLDDNFASIVLGVEEGRRIFDNLKKSIAYTMSANIPELVPFLAYVLFSIPNGIHPIAILCIDIGTDILPAISFAYEPAESDIMLRKPRNPKVDRLVTCKLVRIAYGLIGVIETIGGFFAYFVIFMQNGFWPCDLFWKRDSWDAPGVNDFQDSVGQEWAFAQRQVLESTVSTAFFVAILIMQWSDLLIMKTTRYSLLHQSMSTNRASIYCLYLMTGIGLLACYCPGLDEALGLYPLMWYWWPLAMPFAALMFIYDEIRKFVVRGHPGGWLDRLTTF